MVGQQTIRHIQGVHLNKRLKFLPIIAVAVALLFAALPLVGVQAAALMPAVEQDATPEPTDEPVEEPAAEATAEPTAEATAEATNSKQPRKRRRRQPLQLRPPRGQSPLSRLKNWPT